MNIDDFNQESYIESPAYTINYTNGEIVISSNEVERFELL
jgi:hypothetical protein